MKWYVPTYYYKDVFSIPYEKLLPLGIRLVVFDLDNTLTLLHEDTYDQKVKQLLGKLQKQFLVAIVTNNSAKRIAPYEKLLQVPVISWAMKPSTKSFRTLAKTYHLKPEQMCLIGDQLLTDIAAGNRFSMRTILVDPLGKKDLKVTYLNRQIEKCLFRKMEKEHLLERGNPHDRKIL